jgi:hypothetical protein
MELPQIFSKIKRDIMASVVLTHPDKLKVCHILRQSFKECSVIESKEIGYETTSVHPKQREAFNEIFGNIFNK